MADATLEKVLKEVKALSAEDQRQLRESLDTLLDVPPPASVEDELEHRLAEAGRLSEVKAQGAVPRPRQKRKLIEVKGKPVSETIIEERR